MQMLPTITFNIQPQTTNSLPNFYKMEANNHQIFPIQISPHQQVPRPFPMASPTKFIESYVIDYNREIGHGNFSHVYVALDQRQPNTKLAVKVVNVEILRQQKLQNLINSQVQVLLAMRHENVIFCKDALWDSTYCYIFTEFCEGGSLENKIKKAGLLPKSTDYPSLLQQIDGTEIHLPNVSEKEMLPLVKDIFQAMLYMEKCHIIHRDIKAANIFLKENRAIVADFGFARYVYQPFYDLNIGSLPFMPPEALSANLYSNKTDVWAFGCLLYQVFHGESPYAKSHDIKELIQKAYSPLKVSNIRADLSTQMKELILNCLEVDMEKRKKFSEIQKTWYFRKLFENLSQYNHKMRVQRPKMIESIKINGKLLGQRTSFQTVGLEGQPIQPDSKSHYRSSGGTRSFASRFKEKVHIAYQSKNMDYSDSENISQQKNKQDPQYCPKINGREIHHLGNIPINLEASGKLPDSSNVADSPVLITKQSLGAQDGGRKKVEAHEPKQEAKISFKDVLLRIQEVRNYYKLAITLKDRNRRLTEIKNRLFLKAVKQISKIQKLIQSQDIEFMPPDKNKEKQKVKEGQKQLSVINQSVLSRKSKLISIIKDYKTEFESQVKRRQIKQRLGDEQVFRAELWSEKSSEVEDSTSDSREKESAKIGKNASHKYKSPTLTQDIEYIVETELIYHAEDNFHMSYEECHIYRTKIRQILQDIMHLEHGFLNVGISSDRKTRHLNNSPKDGPSAFLFAESMGREDKQQANGPSQGGLRWKQKSNNQRTHQQ